MMRQIVKCGQALCTIVCVILAGCGPSGEELFKQAQIAAEDKDEELAIDLILQSADKGFHEAMVIAGEIYIKGAKGVEPDKERGFSLIRKAAEEEYPDAMYMLSVCYGKGMATEKDDDKASYWEERALQTESPMAMYSIAEKVYGKVDLAASARKLKSIGTHESFSYSSSEKESMEKAVTLFKRLADEEKFSNKVNVAWVCGNLGHIYEKGIGVRQNAREAVAYYERSAKLGWKPAMRSLGEIYCKGELCVKNYDRGVKLLEKSLDGKRDEYALQTLGKVYMDADWPSSDIGQAKSYFEEAIQQYENSDVDKKYDSVIGDALAWLGRILVFEDEKYRDETEGIRLLERAAEAGNNEGSYFLAVAYYEGIGVKKNVKQAWQLLMSGGYSEDKSIAKEAKKLKQQVEKELGYSH